ncbi:hypothetical protein KIL84_008298 [Mauremys mutica]|uniref:Uncharacterized protein n=1 Tax=Mauremys mutica TaxID=74926 RepID=A0A9D4AZE5_9SAUR|nr:hypothetical protein KIL84_008298 [Mauremys mutica]
MSGWVAVSQQQKQTLLRGRQAAAGIAAAEAGIRALRGAVERAQSEGNSHFLWRRRPAQPSRRRGAPDPVSGLALRTQRRLAFPRHKLGSAQENQPRGEGRSGEHMEPRNVGSASVERGADTM